MRIISPFNDYYDSVMSFNNSGKDEAIVFERKLPLDISIQKQSVLYKRIIDAFDRPLQKLQRSFDTFLEKSASSNVLSVYLPERIETKDKENNGIPLIIHLSTVSVLFCGKVYQGIRTDVVVPSNSVSPMVLDERLNRKRTDYFYDAESLISFLESYPEVNLDFVQKSSSYNKASRSPRKQFNLYFSRNGNDSSQKDFLIEHKLSIAIYHGHDSYNPLEINGRLADVAFYKVFDPYRAFQELDMWLSGVLASPPNFMVELSDDSKIAKAGFDPEYGFRTRPQQQQQQKTKKRSKR